MEQEIKNILGEYAFTIAALQNQVKTLQKTVEEMEKNGDKRKPSKSSDSQ